MAEQYVARDKDTGFEVTVTGNFPEHPDDRMRIARTTTLFARLMSTLLQRDESQRRMGFRAIETQLELADALIRQDHSEVQRLVRETLTSMGVGEDQLRILAERLAEASGLDPRVARELSRAFGLDGEPSEDDDDELNIDIEALSASLLGDDEDSDKPINTGLLGQLEDLLAEADRLDAELKSIDQRLDRIKSLEEMQSPDTIEGTVAGDETEPSDPTDESDESGETGESLKGPST